MVIPTLESYSDPINELLDICRKVYIPCNTKSEMFKGLNVHTGLGNGLYFDALMKMIIEHKLSERDFVKLIGSTTLPIDKKDEYYIDKLDKNNLNLMYIGTHQNAECDIFYSKYKRGFIIFLQNTKASQITDNDIFKFKDVVSLFKDKYFKTL